ncbi:HupE/UreJ family protein [Limnohabitans sp.]|uniref:HupE/UreJ family protein n=1 Tax=Limnohabitans sp. TaxID=1907725 RepID=UPI00286F8FCB|nr:HupE/UreJ family protein [Limnohabitans sp.]
MKIIKRNHVFVLLMTVMAGSAHAHAGHGTFSFFEGVTHPFDWDHVLAMVAVGMWSVLALPARRTAIGPVTFLLMMLAGALMGMAGGSVAKLEALMVVSVLLLAVMLWVPLLSASRVAQGLGLGVVATAALLHGLAHGMEAPAGQASGYVLGFVLATAGLHGVGILTAVCVRRAWSARAASLMLGTAMGGAGVCLLGQLV